VNTVPKGGHRNVPAEPVIIQSVKKMD
jgi:hypothetical protein